MSLAIPETAQRATEVALGRAPALEQLELAFDLPTGAIAANGLNGGALAQMTYDDWCNAGHKIGFANRWGRFALGDWLLAGEQLFDDDMVAQAVEGAPAERYDVAHRITGLDPATLQNYRSLCNRVPLEVRRIELGVTMHQAVQALDHEEQVHWLEQAVLNGWDRESLRDAIREAKREAGGEPEPQIVDPPKSRGERAQEILDLVATLGQPTSDGGAFVPAEAWSQVLSMTGRE